MLVRSFLGTIGGSYAGGLSTYSSGYTPAMPYGGALKSSVPIFSARPSVPQRAQPIAMAGSSFAELNESISNLILIFQPNDQIS